jgi:catechol 2,3-dioxygenase-like lactoylglutathione lyase family enzyme
MCEGDRMIMPGVDHIVVGVSDVGRSLAFYGDLGFTEIAWDYTGGCPARSTWRDGRALRPGR